MRDTFHTVNIQAPVRRVWEIVTRPENMSRWMTEEKLSINSGMKPGDALYMHGNFHGIPFENRGYILASEEEKLFSYSYLSNISRLPDVPENYAVVKFVFTAGDEKTTKLEISQQRSANEGIYRHAAWYWSVTIQIIKKTAEEPAAF